MLGHAIADEPLPRGHYTLEKVKVVAVDRTVVGGVIKDEESDKLTHWIRFDVRPRFAVEKGTEAEAFEITNSIDSSKSKLVLNKPIRFEGREIPAGINLLDFQRFDGFRWNISMPAPAPSAIGSIVILDDFVFEPGDYTFRFEWQTEDGTVFSDEVKVHVDIGKREPGK